MEAIHRVGLQFSVHEDTGQTVVRVVDKDTGELIRQIPPQELLDLASKLEDMMGILFDKQV
jgi:flagellar protein FlaG